VTCILGEETDRYVNKIAPKPVFFLHGAVMAELMQTKFCTSASWVDVDIWNGIQTASVFWRGGSKNFSLSHMGAGTWGAGWATAHPGKNQGGPCPPWKY